MFCPNCKKNISNDVEFCPYCGAYVKSISDDEVQHQFINNNDKKRETKLFSVIIITILVVSITFVGSKLIKRIFFKQNNNNIQQVQEDGNTSEESNVDISHSNINYDKNNSLLIPVEDVFIVRGRGTVVTGRVERGSIKLNDEIQIIGLNHEVITTTVTEMDTSTNNSQTAQSGENVGIFLKDISRDQIEIGQVIAKPNTIKAAKKFEANVNILSKEESGRNTSIYNNYHPQFYFWTTDITGTITLPDGVDKIESGDSDVKIIIELVSNVAMEVGTEFAIREDGATIGRGIVTKIY